MDAAKAINGNVDLRLQSSLPNSHVTKACKGQGLRLSLPKRAVATLAVPFEGRPKLMSILPD